VTSVLASASTARSAVSAAGSARTLVVVASTATVATQTRIIAAAYTSP
jgi:hypothetical protein